MIMQPAYRIRPARMEDSAALPAIELAAGRLFTEEYDGWNGEQTLDDVISAEGHRVYVAQGRSWVAVDADDLPVGFAVASVVDGHAHLDEIDVHPEHGRRGIGRALVERVCVWAREVGFAAISLTTERDIPWNAPFYARLGFRIIARDDLSAGLRAILAEEAEWASTPDTRVAMIRTLA